MGRENFDRSVEGMEAALSRRDLLKGATAGFAASVAGAFSLGCGKGAETGPRGTEAPSVPPVSLPKGFSRDEGERRWRRTRALMKEQHFDCLLVPEAGGEGRADTAYLTQIRGGAWVILPAEGQVTAILDGQRSIDFWKERQNWATDMRSIEGGHWSPAVIERLRELRMERARIGVAGLSGVLRNEEGHVNATTLDRIRRAFPKARFESVAELMMRVKLVRSQEEINVMQQVTAAGEQGIRAMMRTARPGVMHRDIWFTVFDALFRATWEFPSRVAIRAGAEANTSLGLPLEETIQAGQIMNQEIAGQLLGYMAQVNHSICVGTPPPKDWLAAAHYCIELFHALADWIAPGKRFKDLSDLYAERVAARSGELPQGGVLVHTCGQGDGPRMGPTRSEVPDLVIEEGMVFTIKPRVPIRGASPTAQFGDPLLVTGKGARRLGTRKLEPVTVGAPA
ncbi:MAG: M24 family metallopeptidase [Acidobacteria bacterium]|nr:M24 family metallopeptidase [Acidobacteriota bacterium]